MLSNGFDKPLHLTRKPSRLLAAYLVLLHVLVLLALLQPLALASWVQAGLWLIWIFSAGYHRYQYRRQSDVHYDDWVWQTGGTFVRGQESACYTVVAAKSLCTPWFVRLTLAGMDGRQQRLLVVRDQLDVDTFRRLRVRLQLHYDEAASSKDPA